MGPPLLICDLDGTLVDSRPGIAETLRQACLAAGIEPRTPIDGSLIGPPLDELLTRVTGLAAGESLDRLRSIFIETYDGAGCRRTVPFVGVQGMLESLLARGVGLALATNKRQTPTRLILKARGWDRFFDVVETVDSRTPGLRPKSRMLRDIVGELSPSMAAYLGDSAADVDAAREASLPCILAGWGYGECRGDMTTTVAAHPADVLAAFAKATNLTDLPFSR